MNDPVAHFVNRLLHKEIKEQQETIDKLKDCLEFYKNRDYMSTVSVKTNDIIEYDIDAGALYRYENQFTDTDKGRRARQLLKEISK